MMSRFAGAKSGQRVGFEPIQLRSGSVGTQAGSAAGAVSLGDAWQSLRKNSPNFGEQAQNAMVAKARENIAMTQADAGMATAKMQADAAVKKAELQSESLEKQASAAKSAGMMSGIGSIAGAALGLLSDEETKHTVDEIEDALEVLRLLRPVTFFYKEQYSASPERMHYGFIAQEYQRVMPDQTYHDGSIDKLCIDTNELIALLVRANQQLETRVARLEAKQALAAV
jgi:hypothetical protein